MEDDNFLQSLNLPKDVDEPEAGIGLVGKIVSRAKGKIVLRIEDARLIIQENSILRFEKTENTVRNEDEAYVRVVVKRGASIERVQSFSLDADGSDECCDLPLLLSLTKERPINQSVGEIADVDELRQRWAQERGLSVGALSTKCSYKTTYTTSTWFSDSSTDSQTDRYPCD